MALPVLAVGAPTAGPVAAQGRECRTDCPAHLRRDGCCPRTLPPVDAEGTVEIRSSPPGARVTLDGEPRGRTPLRLDRVPAAVHELRIEADGRATHHAPLLVRPGKHVELDIPLCERGRTLTDGRCCWPGQSVTGGSCAGAATCPPPLVPTPTGSECVEPVCSEGQVRLPSGACCFPGQRWDPATVACAGRPSRCPGDLVRGFSGCEAPASRRDEDRDGIFEDVDRCIDEPEDRDGFEDTDGCPDPDNDRDGIADVSDRCPNEPEDRDGLADEDGCPDADADADGVADSADRCPREAEDRDGFEDDDGCPDTDDDADGIPDAHDRCRTDVESPNGHEDDDGCPDTAPPAFSLGGTRMQASYQIGLSAAPTSEHGTGLVYQARLRWLGGAEIGVTTGIGLSVRQRRDSDPSRPPVENEGRAGFLAGVAPVQLGLWLDRVGGDRLVLAEPFVHLAWPAPHVTASPVVRLGNRVTWDADLDLYLEVAFRTGNDAHGAGPEVAVGVVPDPEAEAGRWALPFELAVSNGMQYADGFRYLLGAGVAYRGIGVGGALLLSANSPIAGPYVELAPLRLGNGRVSDDEWVYFLSYFEPFVRATWYRAAGPPSVAFGQRFRFGSGFYYSLEAGYQLPTPSLGGGLFAIMSFRYH